MSHFAHLNIQFVDLISALIEKVQKHKFKYGNYFPKTT